MTATAAEKPQLDYAPTVPWRRRRTARAIFWLLLLLVVTGACYVAYPRVRWQLQVLDWQRRCLAGPIPPDTLVYDERESGVYDLVGGVPSVWGKLYAELSPPGLAAQSTIFIREMRTPGGKRRLVSVDIDRAQRRLGFRSPKVINLSARVVRPGAGMIRPSVASATSHSLQIHGGYAVGVSGGRTKVRVHAGAQDPADPSHFTFSYEVDGRKEIVDGWLGDDDSVTIELRPRPVATPPAPASPASPPTSGGSGRRRGGWPFRVSRSSGPTASQPASSR